MAASPLLQTPTDVMFGIFDLLSVTDLCNFRQTCHWASDQSFKAFATRGYRKLSICDCNDSVGMLESVVKGNKDLAAFVRNFTVRLNTACCKHWIPGTQVFLVPCQGDPKWTATGIISGLPNLENLELFGFGCGSFARHFSGHSGNATTKISQVAEDEELYKGTSTGPARPSLGSVSVNTSYGESAEIGAFVQLAVAGTTKLHMGGVTCKDGQWVDILRKIQPLDRRDYIYLVCMTALAGISRVRILYSNSKMDLPIITKRSESTEATMQGQKAVKIGLETIIKYAAAQGELGRGEMI
ncbi:hypothetical protein LTR27_009624 [Elasticomyces elasticus]|nr:hypothetical protein LTR27_009624 [Elasticomyces elasticus]